MKDVGKEFLDLLAAKPACGRSLRRLKCQTLSPFANSFIVFPDKAEVSSNFLEIGRMSFLPLIKSHCFWSRRRTKYHSPRSFWPRRTKWSLPEANSFAGELLNGSKMPRSQTITVPPPYCPRGMVP